MKIHKYKTMSLAIVIVSLLTAIFVLDGCKPESGLEEKPQQQVEIPQPEFYGFSVTECIEDEHGKSVVNDTVYAVAIDESSLKVTIANMLFNCCWESFREKTKIVGNDLYVHIFSDDEACHCECPRNVEFTISNLVLGQSYNIHILKGSYEHLSFKVSFEMETDMMLVYGNSFISDFSASDCMTDDRETTFENDTVYAVAIDESSLKIKTTNTYFNCCSEEFWEESNMNGNEISVYMYEDNLIPCDCVCPRSVEFILNNLVIGQTYKIILSRNEYEYYSFELVFDEDTDLMFLIR